MTSRKLSVIAPITMNDAQLSASDVPEDDTYSAWSGATPYAAGNTVYVASTHRRYEAVISNTGNDPTTDNGTNWIDAGATTKWRPFDGVIGHTATRATSLYYEIQPATYCNGIALFGLSGGSVRIRQTAASYDRTISLVDTSDIVGWLEYATWSPTYKTEIVVDDVPGAAGSTVRIDLDATGGTAIVGEIAMGRVTRLGDAIAPTSISSTSYSSVTRDLEGNATIVSRPYTIRASYTYSVLRRDEGRVNRYLSGRLDRPSVFFTGANDDDRGTQVYGLILDHDIPISGESESFATLRVEGVI